MNGRNQQCVFNIYTNVYTPTIIPVKFCGSPSYSPAKAILFTHNVLIFGG